MVSGISIFRNTKNSNALNRLKPIQKETAPTASGTVSFFIIDMKKNYFNSFSAFSILSIPSTIFSMELV